MALAVSSMTGGQFWASLKSEADAVSWNLRDVSRNGMIGDGKPSLDRAIQSADRITSMIEERTDMFKRTILDRREKDRK